MKLVRWEPVCLWTWTTSTTTCAICRNDIDQPSIEYEANPCENTSVGLNIAFGDCGHTYHLDCIQRWLKTRTACPLCNATWEFSKIEKLES